jgi:hypothetical protein
MIEKTPLIGMGEEKERLVEGVNLTKIKYTQV